MRLFARIALTGVFFGARLWAQEELIQSPSPHPPLPWQVAGIRAAFGDARQPFVEQSQAVQEEGLKLCAERGWGAVLDAQEVAVYLDSDDRAVKRAALLTLGQMGDEGGRFAKEAAALLRFTDKHGEIRCAAIVALGKMGRPGAAYAKDLAEMIVLNGNAGRIQVISDAAVISLGRMGAHGPAAGEAVVPLLTDPGSIVRYEAASALGEMGEAAAPFAKNVAALLEDENDVVCIGAAEALAKMGKPGSAFAKDVAALLQSPDRNLRTRATVALSKMGEDGGAFAEPMAKLLQDPVSLVRLTAFAALRQMGQEGSSVARAVTASYKYRNEGEDDSKYDTNLSDPAIANGLARLLAYTDSARRNRASLSPAETDEHWGASSAQLDPLLDDDGGDVRASAAIAEGKPTEDATDIASFVKEAPVLLHQHQYKFNRSIPVFLDLCGNPTGDLNLQAALLAFVDSAPHKEITALRAHLRLWAGANEEMQRTVTWLGKPDVEPMPKEGLSMEETGKALRLFSGLLDYSTACPALRVEIVGRIAEVAKAISIPPDRQTRMVLTKLAASLKDQPGDAAAYEAVGRAIGL